MSAMVDVPSGQVVTNDFPQMTEDLSTQWRGERVPVARNRLLDETGMVCTA